MVRRMELGSGKQKKRRGSEKAGRDLARLSDHLDNPSTPDLDTRFAEAGMALMAQQGNYGIWFRDATSDRFHLTANACAVMGVTEEARNLDAFLENVHENDRGDVERRMRTYLEQGEPYDLAYRVCLPGGEERWIRARGHISQEDCAPCLMAGSVEDTTYQVETLNQLQRSELRFRSLIESAPFSVLITRLRDQNIQYLNEEAEYLLSPDGGGVENLHLQDVVQDTEIYAALLEDLAAKGQTRDYEIPLRREGDAPAWVSVKGALIEYDGEPSAYLTFYDTTERRMLEEKLRVQATTDPLTGMANRTEFMAQLGSSIANSNRSDDGFALLLLDLDKFKTVNDSHGHGTGDRLLVLAAQRLEGVLRETDTVARLGGDEFAIIARHLDKTHGVSILAQKIVDVLGEPFDIGPFSTTVGVSVGVTHYPFDKSDPEALLQHADLALYRAKEEGRGRFHLFDEALSRAVHERIELERDLRMAITTDQFFIAYQPRYDARTRKPVAAEALARWRHPDKGLVSPGIFIPLAEETGLVVELGRVVLDKVGCDIARWRSEGLDTGPVSVNISALHFTNADVLEDVLQTLEKYNLPPECLQVEVTESAMIADEEAAASQTKALAQAGIMVLIDDFGTGYSSLSYLHRFAAHELKIDRSFVSNITEPTSAILARQIVSIGKSLDLKIVAEGVETEAQADFMTAIGCDELQGFLLSRPIEADAFEALMRSASSSSVVAFKSEA